MKTLLATLFVIATITIIGCNNAQNTDKTLESTASRGKIISSLVHNHDYMTELMDSMSHSEHLSMMMKKPEMMDNMMEMCKTDSSMCKMMMSKTMDMCDADQGKCNMMSSMMMEHKPMMKCMMDDMNERGMMNEMGEPQGKGKPEDRLQHHDK